MGSCPTKTITFNMRVFHQGTIFHSCAYGHSNGKRDSTVCLYLIKGVELVGTIKAFHIVKSEPIALVQTFVKSGSLLQTVGVPGRQTLEEYCRLDVLSSFVIQVKDQPSCDVLAVPLSSIIAKCIKVHPNHSSFSYIIKLPNCYSLIFNITIFLS